MKFNDIRLIPFVSGIILGLLKASYGIWYLSLTRPTSFFRPTTNNESITVSQGNELLVYAWTDLFLIIGAYKKIEMLLYMWLGLNLYQLVIHGISSIYMGSWKILLCVLFYATIPVYSVIELLRSLHHYNNFESRVDRQWRHRHSI